MNPELQKLIDVVTQQLGIARDHFYPIFVRQIYNEGLYFFIITLVELFAFLTLAVWASGNARRLWAKANATTHKGDPFYFLSAGCAVLTLAGIFGVWTEMIDLVRNALLIANPEYYAVERVLSLIKH
jgi:hypothetical protein